MCDLWAKGDRWVMAWFRLDDSFYSNPKVMAAGNAAVGLWVRCAAWSAAHLTDGEIPVDVAHSFGTRKDVNSVTTARLWVLVDDRFVIPDWLDYQLSSVEVKERRRRDAERKRNERTAGYSYSDRGVGRQVPAPSGPVRMSPCPPWSPCGLRPDSMRSHTRSPPLPIPSPLLAFIFHSLLFSRDCRRAPKTTGTNP